MGQLDERIFEITAGVLNDTSEATEDRLYQALRLLCKYRAELVAEHLAQGPRGNTVRSGPFAGMLLGAQSSEGCWVPKLLGTYEAELHPVLQAVSGRDYEVILNIGCAEGYYAVGLARAFPSATIHAHDTDEEGQRRCVALAQANGVASRMTVGGTFSPEDFARFQGRRALVFCDIEGAEVDLLDPSLAPALRGMDLIVETHDVFREGASDALRARFAPSHHITTMRIGARDPSAFEELAGLEHLDQLLAVWEWRLPGNDWLFMKAANLRA